MVIMEKGLFGQYTGNARHSRTPVTKRNYRASVADDAAHIHYLKEDINYDAKHGHSDENMTADEKHISKLAGDMKYDKKHHGSPAKQTDEREGDMPEVVVTGDKDKVGIFGKQLDKAFGHIQNRLDTGGFGHGTGAQAAGLGYTYNDRKSFDRIKKMREEKGAPHTLRYLRRQSGYAVGQDNIPEFLNMPEGWDN
jgi:hypothetical protein